MRKKELKELKVMVKANFRKYLRKELLAHIIVFYYLCKSFKELKDNGNKKYYYQELQE